MKQNSGFILLEVVIIVLGIFIMLIALLRICTNSMLVWQKSCVLQNAWQYLQQEQLDQNQFQCVKLEHTYDNVKVKEVQMQKGQVVICNEFTVEQ